MPNRRSELPSDLEPDVSLVARDVAGNHLAAVRGICRVAPACAVVVVAEIRDVEDMLDAVRAGAVGYAPGVLDRDRLRRILGAVVANEAVVPRTMVHELLLELRAGGQGGDALTGRESQVLGMLRRGHSTAAIADRLHIAPVTVRRHISELVRKLGASRPVGTGKQRGYCRGHGAVAAARHIIRSRLNFEWTAAVLLTNTASRPARVPDSADAIGSRLALRPFRS